MAYCYLTSISRRVLNNFSLLLYSSICWYIFFLPKCLYVFLFDTGTLHLVVACSCCSKLSLSVFLGYCDRLFRKLLEFFSFWHFWGFPPFDFCMPLIFYQSSWSAYLYNFNRTGLLTREFIPRFLLTCTSFLLSFWFHCLHLIMSILHFMCKGYVYAI